MLQSSAEAPGDTNDRAQIGESKNRRKKASNDQTLQADWSFFAFIATTSADDVVMVVIRVWEGIFGSPAQLLSQ